MKEHKIKHIVCHCGRWWITLREALMDGYQCIDDKCECDYCRYADWDKGEIDG